MEKNYIKEYWEKQGNTHNTSHWASWGDNWMIDLEIDTIAKHIKNGDVVLDVGCANGYSTFQQAEKHHLSSITGVDFADSMVEAAKNALMEKNSSSISFQQGDIRNLNFDNDSFDVVYTTRVVINLPTWEEQIHAIKECIRVTKPGGKIILSEGFWEPLVLLNAMRLLVNLDSLVEHDFNRYLKKNKLQELLNQLNLQYEFVDFSSIYYLGSRFLREIVTDYEKYEGFSNPINKIFAEIQKDFTGGGMGIQQAVVISKS